MKCEGSQPANVQPNPIPVERDAPSIVVAGRKELDGFMQKVEVALHCGRRKSFEYVRDD